ncbi:hypothetical protein ES703_124626 [subsurface metagenome]
MGVTNSESIGPPKVINSDFSRIFKVAGAGIARMPCFVLTFPPPRGILLQKMPVSFSKALILSRAIATPIISIRVSTELSSCKCIFSANFPCTSDSALINEFKTLLA